MTHYVFDTNIVSLILRGDPNVRTHLTQILTPENQILACPLVWYEMRRGFLAKDAHKQMEFFERLFLTFDWQDFTREDWTLAAVLWAKRRAIGRPAIDADLLIAVYARNRNAVLVTDNEKDFVELDVTIENWVQRG